MFSGFAYKCGRQFRRAIATVTSGIARCYLALHGVKAREGLRMNTLPFCRRHRLAVIEIGSNVTILNKLHENPSGITHRSVLVADRPGARLTIGNHVGMSGVVLYCSTEIVIEDYVNLGAGAAVYDTDFHPIDAAARRRHDQDKIKSAPVRICEDAWIGANATILKGVTIGARAVVGAGSIVTNDVPPDTIVAGIPAKPVGRGGSA